MDLNALKSFARDSRKELLKSVALKIEYVLSENSSARRENRKAIIELENKIKTSSKEEIIEEVSYTWFNRFIALQYMDINVFNHVRVILPFEGMTRPQILSNAISGLFDKEYISENTKNIVSSILDGRTPSNDPEKEAYRLLIISFCNNLHSKMPFLFERIADYKQLLIPDDLLSDSSIITKIRDVMTKENCQDVEVIGWLYQYYISEKKDQVFADLKKNKKIKPENIPAATQLFTTNWIVKYLVENSLGRLWMLNNPNSNLIRHMKFYIVPQEYQDDFLKINSPEEIKICDPACGSGHMLTYAFDLLYFIYEEEGYAPNSIPYLILENNLHGTEIDKRAGALASFALTMKARIKQKDFFDSPVKPNICVLENIKFETNELNEYIEEIGEDLFNKSFRISLTQFEESDNFGSLIRPAFQDLKGTREKLESIKLSENIFRQATHERVLKVLEQSDYLSQKYHVVISNPPYMGGKGMNERMVSFLKKNYQDVKYNLFSAFVVRNTSLVINKGQLGFMTPHVWMYISSYEKLRMFLTDKFSINNLVELPLNGFKGATVQICAFNIDCTNKKTANFIRLVDFRGDDNDMARYTIHAIKNNNCGWFYSVKHNNFQKIPGSPIAYWFTKSTFQAFEKGHPLGEYVKLRKGLTTMDNARFLRYWHECSIKDTFFNAQNALDAKNSKKTWFPINKGGTFRRWYGNRDYVINWKDDGKELKDHIVKVYGGGSYTKEIRSEEYYFEENISWSTLSFALSMRYSGAGFIFESKGSVALTNSHHTLLSTLAYANSKVISLFLSALSPTVDFNAGPLGRCPLVEFDKTKVSRLSSCLIDLSKSDWDSFETSWDFSNLPLLSSDFYSTTLEKTYHSLRNHWKSLAKKMLDLEEENNQILIDAYGLQEEITPDVPKHEITLRCNSTYRYGQKVSLEDQEDRLLADTLKEYISYSVGCMFGRYSLDKPGLILANQGDNLKDYLNKMPDPKFMPDDDNVIPILVLDWFEDDITARFKKFLKITFSDQNFEENLRFIENSIGKDIRKYFLNDFYKDHVQTYKKRPIYWMFSSPKGSFNALIYLHRYQKDTVSILLDKYLKEFLLKLRAEKNTLERLEISSNSSSAEKTRATKNIQKIDSILIELQNWQKEVIFPLASQRLEIELDDGVKINYSKFGTALKKISGLN